MLKVTSTLISAYFVMLGTQLIVFTLLDVQLDLFENLICGVVFTIVWVALSLKGDIQWTPSASANSSTSEIASTENSPAPSTGRQRSQ